MATRHNFLAHISNENLQKLISYCLQKARMLQSNGVKCLLVFDGARLKMKNRVELDR